MMKFGRCISERILKFAHALHVQLTYQQVYYVIYITIIDNAYSSSTKLRHESREEGYFALSIVRMTEVY